MGYFKGLFTAWVGGTLLLKGPHHLVNFQQLKMTHTPYPQLLQQMREKKNVIF